MKSAEAVARTQASITFTPEGFIKDATETFLAATGYRLDEIQGQHHRMFCPPDIASSPEYQTFWADFAAGVSNTGEFKRVIATVMFFGCVPAIRQIMTIQPRLFR